MQVNQRSVATRQQFQIQNKDFEYFYLDDVLENGQSEQKQICLTIQNIGKQDLKNDYNDQILTNLIVYDKETPVHSIKTPSCQEVKDANRWTEDEIQKLYQGLMIFDIAEKTKIARFIGTKTQSQVASHMQKLFEKLKLRWDAKPGVYSGQWDAYTNVVLPVLQSTKSRFSNEFIQELSLRMQNLKSACENYGVLQIYLKVRVLGIQSTAK